LSFSEPVRGDTSNISLLFDVMLDAAIELGRTQMTIEEILKLTKGSVIELEKLASEPVEFLVNGKTIARGEVVVIDDNFGIRITEVLSQRARLETI
jgi:flagellar motor switch protein FliN